MLNYYLYPHTTSKEWVTFVHGAGGSSSIWFKQVRDFKKHFNVLILDLRGHGNSKPTLKDTFNPRYTFDSITNDIVEVITPPSDQKISFYWNFLGNYFDSKFGRKKARTGAKYGYGWGDNQIEFPITIVDESGKSF